MPVTEWSDPQNTGGSNAATGKNLGTLGSRGGGLGAPSSDGSAGGLSSGATPGTYDVNVFDPAGTAQRAKQETEDWFAGMKNALFGYSAPDAENRHGGLLGDIPGVGAVARAASETVANAAGAVGTVGKGALDVAGGALEHVHIPSSEDKQLQDQFDRIPDGTKYKQEALQAIERDPGATGHYMSNAVKQANADASLLGKLKPDLTSNLFQPVGSMADAVSNLFGAAGVPERVSERGFAGVTSRLDEIMAVGNTTAQYGEDKGILGTGLLAGAPGTGLNPVEAVIYKMVSDGSWSRDEALDFLVSHGGGWSHNQAAELVGNVLGDPTVLASLGSLGVAKIVSTGAKLAEAVSVAEKAVSASETALEAVRSAGAPASDIAAAEAKVAEDTALLEKSYGAMREHGSSNALNILGKAQETKRGTDIVRALYKVYTPLQAYHIDGIAKVVRTIIDPLSSIGDLRVPGSRQTVDLLSTAGTRMVISVNGDVNHLRLLGKVMKLPGGSKTLDMITEDLGNYAGNLIRRVIANSQRDTAFAHGLGDALAKTVPDMDLIEKMAKNAPPEMEEYVLREANHVRIRRFDPAATQDLGKRMEQMYGQMDAEEWAKWLDKNLNDDMKSLLHQATYGRTQKLVMAAREASKVEGKGGALADKIDRLIVINRNTLTKQGAGGIIKDIASAASTKDKAAVVEAARLRYPELRGFALDKTDLSRSVDRFSQDVERTLEHRPMQVEDAELAQLGSELQDIHGGAFTLGFAPEDEYKWGLMRTNEAGGKYAPISSVWTDHVADGLAMGYKPVMTRVAQNVNGKPILGAAVRLLKPIDYINAGIGVMGRNISGAIIADSARQRFTSDAVLKYSHAGMTEELAGRIMDELDEAVAANDLVVRASGLTATNMWEVAKDIIPRSISRSEFGKRELLSLVLDAYKGDMRHVGVTQALSSRIKKVLAFDSNTASVIAEQTYPFLKYRMNAIFQTQEKIEPYILNILRGIVPARGTALNEADKATQRLLWKMQERSLVSNADYEMAEQAAGLLVGNGIEQSARSSDSALGRITQKTGLNWDAIREVKGVKRANMLRTFRKGLGEDMRKVWEEHQPGLWKDMYLEAQRKAGKGLLSEDDFAVGMLSEQMMGNDVVVHAMDDRLGALARQFDKVDYRAAISPGEWMRPQDFGSMRTLDLDTMAEMLNFEGEGGNIARTQGELRAMVAAKQLSLDDIEQGLRRANADPDYIARVRSSLEFSWTGFWQTVRHDFGVSPKESIALENMIAQSADMMNMTPVDYLSQFLSSKVGLGSNEATVGHMGQLVEIMRKEGTGAKAVEVGTGEFRQDLSKLNVVSPGGGTPDELARQLATVFSAHLAPSAKRELLQAFDPTLREAVNNGTIHLDMQAVSDMWGEKQDSELARYMMGTLNGTPGDEWNAALPRTPEEFDAFAPPREVPLGIKDENGDEIVHTAQVLGDGIRNHPDPAFRDSLIAEIARSRQMFPGIPLAHVDVVPFSKWGMTHPDVQGAFAWTVGTKDDMGTILLNESWYGGTATQRDAMWADEHTRNLASAQKTHFGSQQWRASMPRQTNMGVEFSAEDGPLATLRHEIGHQVDLWMAGRSAPAAGSTITRSKSQAAKLRAYKEFRKELWGGPAHRAMSEYGFVSEDEMMGELWSLALNPKADLKRFDRPIAPEDMITESGPKPFDESAPIGFNDEAPDMLHNRGPQTVEEAVNQLRAVAKKAGVMKDAPEFTTDPNIIRATQQFSKWTTNVIKQHMTGTSPYADLLERMSGMPTHAAVPYSASEHEMLQAATQAMQRKWDDAHRLQYYSRNRTMLERSINHPMFGIYPASYMWGKMIPEIIRFVAREPFGLRTGAAAYSMLDIQRAVALQREFDPTFDKKLDELKHSPAMFAFGYLMPTMPDSAGAALPGWSREFAKEGNDMGKRIAAGGYADTKTDVFGTGINPGQVGEKATDLINPLKPIERTVQAPLKDLGASARDRGEPVTAQPVKAGDLTGPLEDVQQILRGLLGG